MSAHGAWLSLMSDTSSILSRIEQGDPLAAAELLPLLYDELRMPAASRLANEQPGQTLQATALVHEAYLRLVGSDPGKPWDGRGHFFAAAAEAMRRILIDRARQRDRLKHGGEYQRIAFDGLDIIDDENGPDLLALDDALAKLAIARPEIAELVRLRFFTGLSVLDAAAVIGVSSSTADRHWTYARAWLFRELGGGGDFFR